MNSKIAVPAIFLLGVFCQSAADTKVYQCIDSSGRTIFSDHCPPGTRKKETQFQTKAAVQSLKKKPTGPVVLYSVKQCDACDLVRNLLKTRKVPFTEKNVADDVELQKEIRKKSGSVTVPLTLIGGKTVRGYDSYALDDAIVAEGYWDKDKDEESQSDDAEASASLPENDSVAADPQ